MTNHWAMEVARDELSQAALVDTAPAVAGDGEAVLRVDRVGMTANNVTYALLGEALRYWEFFPASPGAGRVPLWGFAEVEQSTVDGVRTGDRYYGYLPPASHLVVRPDRVDARGFRDASPHRTSLPSPYNSYALTSGDAAYSADEEDLQILYRPLFFTSFVLADSLAHHEHHGAEALAFSSASSKTAYGTAFLLHGDGPRLVGLTSPANVAFTESLGCYDEVLPYDRIDDLDPARPTAYLDFAGSKAVAVAVREHLGDRLVHDVVVGATHRGGGFGGDRAVFFAPDWMRKRAGDWGRDGLDRRFAEAWTRFAPAVKGWVDVAESRGPQALRDVWLEVLAGRSAPRTGHVVAL